MAALNEAFRKLFAALNDGDLDWFQRLVPEVAAATMEAGPEESAEVLGKLLPILADVPLAVGVIMIRVAGTLAERTDPTVVLPVLAERVTDAMQHAALFGTAWKEAGLGDLPDASDQNQWTAALGRFGQAASVPENLPELTDAFFAGSDWAQVLLFLMQRKDVRLALPSRDRVTEAIAAVREDIGTADWLYGLLMVADDEVLTVVHRATGRGYEVVISGIADNFQLHTLLAARLTGDQAQGFLPGEQPSAAEIAAATDGPELEPPGGMKGVFNLVDGFGAWIWNEGRPTDIPRLEGERVVVLDPPPYPRTWNAGRVYQLMAPSLEVTRVLSAEEAGRWLSLVKPAAVPGRG